MCVEGARAARTLLAGCAAPVATLAVWLPMYPGDAREQIDPSLLPQSRQWWDGDRAAGRWLAVHMPPDGMGGEVAWDAFWLFGPEARWDERPAPVAASGSPVVRHLETLRRALTALPA